MRPAKAKSASLGRGLGGASRPTCNGAREKNEEAEPEVPSSSGILVYLHRPIGAPIGTVRLSLEVDPAVLGRNKKKNSTTTTTKTTGYWAVPHKWNDLPAVWNQQHGLAKAEFLHLELSGSPLAWQTLSANEWDDCCRLLCGNGPLRSGPSNIQVPRNQRPGSDTADLRRRTRRSPQGGVCVCVPSIRFLDSCLTPEQQGRLLHLLHPRRLEICGGGGGHDDLAGVRRALEPVVIRQQQPNDPNDTEDHERDDGRLKELVLHGLTLEVEDCRSVAQLLTPEQPVPSGVAASRGGGTENVKGGGLRSLTLRSVTFACREGWELLAEAMRSSPSLECAKWDGLCCRDGAATRQGSVPQRLDPDDDDNQRSRSMRERRDELAMLHAFNALHRVACEAIRTRHQPTHRHRHDDNQRQHSGRQEWQESVEAIGSAMEVLRQWYLSTSSSPSSPSRDKPNSSSSPSLSPPQVPTTIASPPPPKGRTVANVPRRIRPPPGCS